MTARHTKGPYKGMTPYQVQDAEEFGDWGDEAIEGTADARDFTPAPPCSLDPRSVLRNQRRARIYIETGKFTWPGEPEPKGGE